MDIEFVEEKYRDDIFKLMEVCGIEMAEAYELYVNAGNSFENAMQMFFNPGAQQNSAAKTENFGYNEYGQENQYLPEQTDDFDTLYQKYKIYKQNGLKFANKYEDRNNVSFFSSLVPKFFKGQQNQNFKKLLQEYFDQRPCAIKFVASSLSHTLATSQKFPVIAYILDFSPANKSKVQQILRSNHIAEMVNVQYKNIGIDPNYDVEKSLAKFVDRKKYNNSLVILRVNAIQEVETISHIPLSGQTTKDVLERLKLAKNNCISKDLDEGHLERRYQQELMGNYDYQKPMSIAQKRKVAQDRQIRKKQEEQFFASMKAQQKKQEQKPTVLPPPQINSQIKTPEIKKQIKKQEKEAKIQAKRNLQEERRQLREKLKIYSEGMHIRLRLPNGEAVVLTVESEEKARYLYNYVSSMEKDIGFERDADRKFDIIRPYDKLNLSDNLDRTLKQIFQGSDSQNLAVSET